MSFEKVLLEDRRLCILRVLADLPGYKSNSSVLTKLLQHWGHPVARDWTRTQVAWLTEQGLVSTESVNDVLLVTLTERGLDVAKGLAHVPGIARPGA